PMATLRHRAEVRACMPTALAPPTTAPATPPPPAAPAAALLTVDLAASFTSVLRSFSSPFPVAAWATWAALPTLVLPAPAVLAPREPALPAFAGLPPLLSATTTIHLPCRVGAYPPLMRRRPCHGLSGASRSWPVPPAGSRRGAGAPTGANTRARAPGHS